MSASLVLQIALALEPQMEAKPLGASRHLLEMTIEAGAAFEAAQAALTPTARRQCADRTFFWGAFKFTEPPVEPAAKSGAAQISFQQELYCSSSGQLSPRPATAAPGPSEAQQQAVLEATYNYLAAKDSNRLPGAYAMLSPRAKLTTPETEWIAKTRDFNRQAGAVRARRVTDISWYSDPPEAPERGLYVAADFHGAFDKLEFLCGYVVWKLDADGTLRLVREEQNFLERRRGAKLSALDRAPTRAQMGCKD